jgi:hypothetical protein
LAVPRRPTLFQRPKRIEIILPANAMDKPRESLRLFALWFLFNVVDRSEVMLDSIAAPVMVGVKLIKASK